MNNMNHLRPLQTRTASETLPQLHTRADLDFCNSECTTTASVTSRCDDPITRLQKFVICHLIIKECLPVSSSPSSNSDETH